MGKSSSYQLSVAGTIHPHHVAAGATHEIPPLPLQQPNLKPLKISRRLPRRPSGQLFGPRRRLPLVPNLGLFKGLPDRSGTGSSGEGGDGVGSEDEVTVSDGLSGDRGVGSVNEGLGWRSRKTSIPISLAPLCVTDTPNPTNSPCCGQ